MASILDRADLQPAAAKFASACAYSRQHNEEAAQALQRHGDHGALISGCVRDHFPDDVKNHLRLLAFLVTEMSEAAYSLRPRGVRLATMRKLSRAVATRDGAGFYGPQPERKEQSQ